MAQTTLKVGNKVEVLEGPFAGSTGVVADIQPECSAIRIQDGTDNIYALIDTVRIVSGPAKRNVMSKRG
jgi:hypothetical protein